jgi:octaprenyl-diphosphate synthase
VTSQLVPITLAGIQHPVRVELDAVFAELQGVVQSDFPLIGEVNKHLFRMKGKLLRPTLLLLGAKASDRLGPGKVTLAAAIELIHLATLVHDDSVDHSVLRRGQPTVNAMFSHEVAVIMGDYLYSRAIIALVELADIEALRVVSRVTNELTVGEMRELESYDGLGFSEDAYQALIEAKTASLMSGACEVGAIDAEPEYREALKRYGLLLGKAFQITDDILDYTESESITGKPTGLDLREHKITLPLILALPRMSADERAAVEALMADPHPSDESIASVIAIVEDRDGIALARERAVDLAGQASAELATLPSGAAREALTDCLTYAVERRS